MKIREPSISFYSEQHGFLEEVFNLSRKRTKYTKNEIRVYEDGVCEIDVYDPFGKKRDTATFSKCDLDKILKHKWYKDNTGYLCTTINNIKVRLHRLLFPNQLTDHYNNNKMNNERSNLQPITHALNIAKIKNKSKNKTGVTGVHKTRNNTWAAQICVNNKTINKNFKDKDSAILFRYILELNNWGYNSPQLEKIEKEYPQLLGYFKVNKTMKITEDISLAKEIITKLKQDPHCPCMLKKTEDTLCPCAPCRLKQICCCGLFEPIKEEI